MADINQDINHDIIVGIDLGTSNSAITIWRNNKCEVIPNPQGTNTIPSMVAFTNSMRYIGQEAKNQSELNSQNVFYEVKRLMGRKFTDISVQQDLEFLTYKIESDADNNILISNNINPEKKYTPEEISAMILYELKTMAITYLKQDITKAIITVPAYFNDSQRQATKDAAIIAGLECVRIINEPTSAALAYGLYNRSLINDKSLNVLVYDFGGGTLDVSVLNITDGLFEVLGSAGNTHLGGLDFDKRLMRYCLYKFKLDNNYSDLDIISSLSIQKLRKQCENAKKLLSQQLKTNIAIKNFYNSNDLFITITQDKLNELCADLLLLSIKPIEDVLNSCNLSKNTIDEIILVGGMTRMPIIRSNIKQYFNKELNYSVDPDEAVAIGASIQGYKLSHEDDPFSESITLLDIVSLSLGVETFGGIMDTIIHRNTYIPITKSRTYTTDSDFETSVIIKIYEGERQLTKDNFFVGEFELKGIQSLPKGIPKIKVCFEVDVNGIIRVSASYEDDKNKVNNSIIIVGNKGHLKTEQIEKLVKEAKEYELKDKQDKNKKQYYLEIVNLCKNIRTNAQSPDLKLIEEDKNKLIKDIDFTEKWLVDASNPPEEEYTSLIAKLKTNYGILILQSSSISEETVPEGQVQDNIHSTTIYDNNDTDNKLIFEKLENEERKELGLDNSEIKELRVVLKDLCDSMFDLLDNDMNLPEYIELKNYIDDTLLWMHIHTNITKIDYQIRIKQINDLSNKIFDNNQNNRPNYKTELEILCNLIKGSISNDLFDIENIGDSNIIKLNNMVDENISILNSDTIMSDDYYLDKINAVNDLCNQIYQV